MLNAPVVFWMAGVAGYWCLGYLLEGWVPWPPGHSPSFLQAPAILEDTLGGGLWLGCHGDLLTAEEIAALLCCYLYGTYPPIIQLA